MPGHHSLLSPKAAGQQPLRGASPAGFGMDPRQQAMMAAPSFFDRMLGRGSYVKEFSARRGNIIKQAQLEKRRRRLDFRRQKTKYMDKLERGDKKTYQHFNIKPSQRSLEMRGTTEKVERNMRLTQRAAMRQIEHQRDRDIREMRDDMRSDLYSTSA